MGILPALISTVLHLSCVAIDMVLVLLFFRIIGHRRHVGWVAAINDAAKAVVDPLTTTISLRWQALTAMRLSQRRALLLSMSTLCLVRFMLGELARLLA